MHDFLILGGTGKTGRRIARRLRAAGLPVRTAARTGADVRFDLADPATWRTASSDISAAYLVEPELRLAADAARLPRFVERAVEAGARRLVLLSAGDGAADHPMYAAEEAVRGSGVGWTVLRPDWFAQNFSESFWLPGILDGTLSLPAGSGGTPFVDAEDIAEVAALALRDDEHSGRHYRLTGPRSIGFHEATELIGAATGREIRYVDVDPEVHIARQIAAGVPAHVARLLTAVLGGIAAGCVVPGDGVERALGRPPMPFEEFITRAAASGVWHRRG